MLDKINSHMSIGARLGLVSGLFVASSAFVTSVFVIQAQGQIEFSERERDGTRYLVQVWGAMEQGGRVDASEAQEQFNAGAAADAFHAAQGEVERVLAGLSLITAVADGSNLTLDPELDSYYAMEAVTVRIPALRQAALEFEQAVASTADPLERELMLNVAAGKLEEAGARAVRSLEAAMDNNASGQTRQALSEPAADLGAAVESFVAAGRTAGTARLMDGAGAAFESALGATWRAAEAELSRLLDARVGKMRSQLMTQLALIAAFLISAGALAWLVANGLGKRFKSLTGAMDRLRAGEMTVEIPHADDRCETGKIAQTLDALRQAIVERERLAEGKAAEQTRVVESLALALKRLADGDLTCRINESFPKDYEQLRADFNAAMEKLLTAMKTIIANASGIRSGAGEISQAADDLSRRTEQQAASLEETVAALDEITATVRKTAEGSTQANGVVSDARADAEASGQVVREAVAAMSEIERSAKQISQIIGVIDEIAFQTNLLALNAGVEAARAGEAGRGFAVVASEVRALAQRSSEAAKEIKGLISASTQHVETGVELVGQAGQALQLIVDKVGEISGLIGTIAASAQEQATGLSQVNSAINQMDQVTQQNAAMVEQSTAASHALTQEAEELMRLVSRFSTGEPPQSAHEPTKQPIAAQKQRVAAFAASRGNAALKLDGDDWQEF